MMIRTLSKVVLRLVAFGGLFCASAQAFGEGVHWFLENADSIEQNTERRWDWDAGLISREDDHIVVNGEKAFSADPSLRYQPPAAPADTVAISITNEVAFMAYSDTSIPYEDSLVSVTLIRTNASELARFALLDRYRATPLWVVSETVGDTGIYYQVVADFSYEGGNHSVTMKVRRSNSNDPFLEVGTLRFSDAAALITGLAYTGYGWLKSLEAKTSDKPFDEYSRWSGANAIMTWAGTAASITATDTACFKTFSKGVNGTWAEGNPTYYGGVSYSEFPGYKGTAVQFHKGFIGGDKAYSTPGMALRFRAGAYAELNVKSTPFALGGLLVEEGATGYSITGTGASVTDTWLGDVNGSVSTAIRVNETFVIDRAAGMVTFFGPVSLEIAADRMLQLTGAATLDAASNARLTMTGEGVLKCTKLTATGRVTLDYSNLSASRTTPYVDGSLVLDAMTVLRLPSWVDGVEGFKLCSGTIDAPASSLRMAVVISGATKMVDATFEGGTMKFVPHDYSAWADNPAVFTWIGSQPVMNGANGVFRLFDIANSCDGDAQYYGDRSYSDIPGRYGTTVSPFVRIFNESAVGGAYCNPGYVLRFAAGYGVVGEIDTGTDSLDLGGMIVEAGASGCALSGGAVISDLATRFGDSLGQSEGRFEFNDDFLLNRTGSVSIVGSSVFAVARDKVFEIRGAEMTLSTNVANTALVFEGEGSLKVGKIVAKGAVRLDYSRLAIDSVFVNGALEIDEQTSFALPAALPEGQDFVLCSGAIAGAVDGVRWVRFGDVMKRVVLTFTPAQGKVRYVASTEAVNEADLGGSIYWKSIAWKNGYVAGRSDVFTLTSDATIILDGDMGSVPMMIVSGGHRLEIVVGDEFAPSGIKAIQVTDGSEVYFVLNEDSKGWGQDLTVPKANCSIVLSGTTAAEKPATEWKGALTVNGALIIRGKVKLSSAGNSVGSTGSIAVEPNGELQYVGGENSMAGTLSIAAYASMLSLTNNLLSTSGSPVIEVRGTLNLGNTCWAVPMGVTIRHYTGGVIQGNGDADGVALVFGSVSGAFVGYEVLAGEDVSVSNADITAKFALNADAAISIARDLRFRLQSDGPVGGLRYRLKLRGEGVLEIRDVTQLWLDSSVACGGIDGAGLVMFTSDPSNVYGGMFTNACWKGTVWFAGCNDLSKFDPRLFGNEKSKIRMSDCECDFCYDNTIDFPSPLELMSSSREALKIRQGYARAEVGIDRLIGDGTLWFSCSADSASSYALNIRDSGEYTGSIKVKQGDIELGENGDFSIASNATWTVEDGRIRLTKTTSLENRGLIAGRVAGGGTVYYRGAINSDKIEEAAGYDLLGEWTGSVVVVEATLNNMNLAHAANPDSRLIFKGATGTLAAQQVSPTIGFEDAGLTVSGTKAGTVVTFDKINGDGPLAMTAGRVDNKTFYRVLDVTDFNGRLSTSNGAPGFVVGEMAMSVDNVCTGQIQLVEAATMRVPPDNARVWRASSYLFGDTLNVIGGPGVALFDVATLANTEYDKVKIHPTLVDDSRLVYRLLPENYGNGVFLFLNEAPTPPELEIKGLDIEYGTDMRTAAISLSITNFWAGAGYDGRISATVVVRDAAGRIVAIIGRYIDPANASTFDLGTVKLPTPNGSNYTYELQIGAAESEYTDPTTIVDMVDCEPLTHLKGNWFTKSFECCVSETDYRPDRPSAGEVVKVEMSFNIPTGSTDSAILMMNGLPMFKAYRNDADEICVKVTKSFDELAMAMVSPMFGTFGDEGGSNIALRVTLNYLEGTVCYQLGSGSVLTNAVGDSLFPMGERLHKQSHINVLRIGGNAYIHSLVGDDETPILAQVISGSSTNDFASLDAALEFAASNNLEQVNLLWDASWSPSTNENAHSFRIEKNGFDLTLDTVATNKLAEAGYEVVVNVDGSYSVRERGYELSFAVNWATPSEIVQGVMAPRRFTVLNSVVTNVANEFVVEGRDFVCWNDRPDGFGEFSFTNHADVAILPMGLKNTTLYAQWKVQQRQVVIEAADEFVYVESVQTNGVNFSGVAYQQTDAAKATGRVMIPVNYGCDELVIRFSTDIGKRLTYDERDFAKDAVIKRNITITNERDNLPHLVGTFGYLTAFSPVQAWAASKGLDVAAASSAKYAMASSQLDLYEMLDDDTEVVITDLSIVGGKCRFHVTINGEPVRESAQIADMVKVSRDLSNWNPAKDVTVGADGLVEAQTGDDGEFIKIVIKSND